MNEEEEQMLDEALEAESGLTLWEIDFVDSLDKLYRKKELSFKQIEILQRIADNL